MLPPVINIPPAMVLKLIGSFNIINDINIVSGTLSLSIGATRETSPFWAHPINSGERKYYA